MEVNKENELDSCIMNTLPVRKALTSNNARTRKGFSNLLNGAISELKEETDRKVAMKYQLNDSNYYRNQDKQVLSGYFNSMFKQHCLFNYSRDRF